MQCWFKRKNEITITGTISTVCEDIYLKLTDANPPVSVISYSIFKMNKHRLYKGYIYVRKKNNGPIGRHWTSIYWTTMLHTGCLSESLLSCSKPLSTAEHFIHIHVIFAGRHLCLLKIAWWEKGPNTLCILTFMSAVLVIGRKHVSLCRDHI